jgi:hypothetical protein
VKRLAKKIREAGALGIITSAYSRPTTQAPTTNDYLAPTHRMLRCGAEAGMVSFDTHPMFHEIAKRDPKRSASLFVRGVGHMSRAGNDLIAQEMARIITSTTARP